MEHTEGQLRTLEPICFVLAQFGRAQITRPRWRGYIFPQREIETRAFLNGSIIDDSEAAPWRHFSVSARATRERDDRANARTTHAGQSSASTHCCGSSPRTSVVHRSCTARPATSRRWPSRSPIARGSERRGVLAEYSSPRKPSSCFTINSQSRWSHGSGITTPGGHDDPAIRRS